MGRRKTEAETIDWLIKGSGIRENDTDMQTRMTFELSNLKRQSSSVFHSILRQHTKFRKKQEKERRT